MPKQKHTARPSAFESRNLRRLFLIMALALPCIIAAGRASAADVTVPLMQAVGSGTVNWLTGQLTASAQGEVPADFPQGQGDDPQVALRVALLKARSELFSSLPAVVVDKDTLVSDLLREDAKSEKKLRGVVHNARIVDRMHLGGGAQEVVVAIDIHDELARNILPEMVWVARVETSSANVGNRVDEGSGVLQPEPWETISPQGYTGLVIDARGLRARPALLPEIFDLNGLGLYGPGAADKNRALQRGLVAYASRLDSDGMVERVGPRPLHLRAVGVKGRNRCDLVVDKIRAERILRSPQTRESLSNCQVLILMD